MRQTAKGQNWVARSPGSLERIEACFSGAAFSPHRHDSYALCVTLTGVQTFDYRGATRHSEAGQVVVLHPDELHDGRAGDERAFRYRAIYIEPGRILDALEAQALPFLQGGTSEDLRLKRAVGALLRDMDRPLGALEEEDAVYDVAAALGAVCGGASKGRPVNRAAAVRARAFIDANVDRGFALDALERAAGHGRWQLSRDFRALFGTSPYRYLTLRRLDRARALMVAGHTLAEASAACGFADQSHFGRHFKQAYGLSPKAWLRTQAIAHDRSILR
jgi:AraC-like DNA-binding protein